MATLDNFETKHFHSDEFACPCCGVVAVNHIFFDKLCEARDLAGVPFRIESACRCDKHNKAVGGKPRSAHVVSDEHPACYAVDLNVPGSRDRFKVLKALYAVGFKRIGVGMGTLIHVDNDPDLPKEVCWTYK